MPVTVISKPVNIYENKIIKDVAIVIKEGLRLYLGATRGINCDNCGKSFEHDIKKTQKCRFCGVDLSDKIAKQIANIMYKIYNRDLSLKPYFKDIYKNEQNIQYKAVLIKMNNVYQRKLIAAEKFLIMHDPSHFFIEKGYWVRVWPTSAREGKNRAKIVGGLKKRLYLNIDPQHFDEVISSLVLILTRGVLKDYKEHILLKFINPLNPKLFDEIVRAEKLVVYYSSSPAVHKALMHWTRAKKQFLRPHAPLFTTEIVPGAGVAYEPSPEHHIYHDTHTKQGEASFGSFITLVVGRYLQGWILKHKKIPNNAEILQIAKDVYYHKIKVLHKFPGM